MRAPFPYFGGKASFAPLIWTALGDVYHYIEPFCGSAATLLARPSSHTARAETVNDADGFVANFWRALKADRDAVARHADHPVTKVDLDARHNWLVQTWAGGGLADALSRDPDWCDPKAAGWWLYGICAWVGSGWCSGEGPWIATADGWINRKQPHLADPGRGINRKQPHLADPGMGINRQQPHLGNPGMGELVALSERLRRTRVMCGDWSAAVGSGKMHMKPVGVFFDPPYSAPDQAGTSVYGAEATDCARDVAAWCREHGEDAGLRIVLAGYEGEHDLPGWRCVAPGKKAGGGGFGSADNAARERLWLSPHCLKADAQAVQGSLFGGAL